MIKTTSELRRELVYTFNSLTGIGASQRLALLKSLRPFASVAYDTKKQLWSVIEDGTQARLCAFTIQQDAAHTCDQYNHTVYECNGELIDEAARRHDSDSIALRSELQKRLFT